MPRPATGSAVAPALLTIALIATGLLAQNPASTAPSPASAAADGLGQRIERIVSRPEFRHATFGIEFFDLDSGKAIYQLNPDELFTPASTTKLLTEGTALELLGADFRFHTRVYGIGRLKKNGTLKGDLVLVASGDPNLSGRMQADGTLAFENEDHCYGGSVDTRAVPGDPLAVIRKLAAQVAAHGVKRIEGRVLVDTRLFPEGEAELGTGSIVSPVIVNDNIIDVTASPGTAVGAPVQLHVSPDTAYTRFVNQATTGKADSEPDIKWAKDQETPAGSHLVIVTGSMPLGKPSILFNYDVPQPSRFAEFVLVEALRQVGVRMRRPLGPTSLEHVIMAGAGLPILSLPQQLLLPPPSAYAAANLLAEHVSPPLSEEVKVTLKVSQNLHASVTPSILGAVLAHTTKEVGQAGFDLERGLLQKAGLDLSGASQSDGAGGSEAAFFTPDFMVHYLAYMSRQKDFNLFFNALPILGRDGTLWNIQTQSAAAGHVHAKTGTYGAYDALNKNLMVTGKGLAGYMTTVDGRHLCFAAYANRVAVPMGGDATTKIVGQALGEIAGAGYLGL